MTPTSKLPGEIQARGYRLTRQRKLILDILEASQEHLDAEEVYLRARQQDSDISLATVYRSLSLLKEIGLVSENRFGEEHRHFETLPDTPHYHFTCIRCGRVLEFEAPEVEQLAQSLGRRAGVRVTNIRLNLSGLCQDCELPDGPGVAK